MNGEILEALREARSLIYEREDWIQNCGARDSVGNVVDPADIGAACFCAAGAVEAACWNTDLGHDVERVLDSLRDFLPRQYRDKDGSSDNAIFAFNDNAATTHAEVVKVFDRAISELGICEAEADAESCGGIV